MKIYTLTSISNSYSMGYFAYLACVESWIDISEKVIVTDGHSNDSTIEKLFEHIPNEKHKYIDVIQDDTTYWAKDSFFNVSQLSLTWNHIIENVDCDWLIVVNADYVYDDNGINLKEALSNNTDELVVKFNRYKSLGGIVKYDDRGIILNIKKMKKENIKLGFCRKGLNKAMSDFPGIFRQKTQFIDSNGVVKNIYAGEMLSRDVPNVGIECGVYGHFFFTKEQCLFKCKRWSEAISRTYGTSMEEDRYILLKNNIYREIGGFNRNEVLEWKHPKYIENLIYKFVNKNSLCMKKFKKNRMDKFFIFYYRIKHKLLTIFFKIRGLESLEKNYKWCQLDEECNPLDLINFYKQQNRYYKK